NDQPQAGPSRALHDGLRLGTEPGVARRSRKSHRPGEALRIAIPRAKAARKTGQEEGLLSRSKRSSGHHAASYSRTSAFSNHLQVTKRHPRPDAGPGGYDQAAS